MKLPQLVIIATVMSAILLAAMYVNKSAANIAETKPDLTDGEIHEHERDISDQRIGHGLIERQEVEINNMPETQIPQVFVPREQLIK